jgi:hypothetical protein
MTFFFSPSRCISDTISRSFHSHHLTLFHDGALNEPNDGRKPTTLAERKRKEKEYKKEEENISAPKTPVVDSRLVPCLQLFCLSIRHGVFFFLISFH